MTANLQFNSGLDGPRHQSPPELLLQSAINALPTHVAILNDKADIIGLNTAWRRFGDENDYNDPNHGMGRNYIEICDNTRGHDAEEAGIVAEGIRDIMNERRAIFQLEYPCHSARDRRWFTLQIARFDWQKSLRIITAHQNVTELKSAQQALAQSQKRLQTIVDAVVDGIFTANEMGIIESVNPAVCEIFGYAPDELVGQSIARLMPPPYDDQYIGYILRHRHVSGRRYAEVGHEVQGVRNNGTPFPMYIAMSRAHHNNRWLFTGIVQDLTPRKRIEHEIIEKEKLRVALEKEFELRDLKDRFMSMISHELRTPLSVILLSSDFLKRYSNRMSEEEKLEAIATIQTQVYHLESVVDDVSALSRADKLDTNIRTQSVDLVDLCSDIVANMQMLTTNDQHIVFNTQGDCINILADTKLLRQAITNLLSNAAKYSPPGATIQLDLKCEPGFVIMQVIDDGIGIPEEDQRKLFQPFHRASNVDTRQGTGLGLAVTKRAIELHGGTISFESQQNVGTTFTINLPVVVS